MDINNFIFIIIGITIGIAIVNYNKRIGNNINGDNRRVGFRNPRELRMPQRDFPHQWRSILEDRVEFYQKLNREDRKKFEQKMHIFLLNVRIEGMQISVEHEDRVLIAASAIIPIFRFPKWHYKLFERSAFTS